MSRRLFVLVVLSLLLLILLPSCGGGGGKNETPTAMSQPTGTTTSGVPVGWQTAQTLNDATMAQSAKDLGIDLYFPANWTTMSQPNLPILILDPTFFPNAFIKPVDVPAGTTVADMPTWVKDHYPIEKGGDTTDFKVVEEGLFTFDNGVTSPYLIYVGTTMGMTMQTEHVYTSNGANTFIF